MKVASYLYRNQIFEAVKNNSELNETKCQLVLAFGLKDLLINTDAFSVFKKKFPNAHIATCSTAGEIFDKEVLNDSVSLIAFEFEKTTVESKSINIENYESSYQAGIDLIKKLNPKDLKYVLVLSDGNKVNGSDLLRGINSIVQHKIPVTGGVAGDGDNFKESVLGLNEIAKSGNIIAVGLYGDAIKISHGSMGGWETFGLEKTITKSISNELFEIDDNNALDLYKKYLGKYADELPSSALLFPLSIKVDGVAEPIVRTIISINDETKSMTFAGDVPEGAQVRFMKANFDKLIDAASKAAHNSMMQFEIKKPKFALLISCVGRKLILGNRVDEELEAVSDVFNNDTILSGFYSYGEISPFNIGTKSELHNQTMTITSFDEF